MREPVITIRFKKDAKRQKKRGKQRAKLEALIQYICAHGDAPEDCRSHNLVRDWKGYRECHIEPDWLLIFTVEDETVTFHRNGTHADLFR